MDTVSHTLQIPSPSPRCPVVPSTYLLTFSGQLPVGPPGPKCPYKGFLQAWPSILWSVSFLHPSISQEKNLFSLAVSSCSLDIRQVMEACPLCLPDSISASPAAPVFISSKACVCVWLLWVVWE